eukprot:TRINITY_DN6734_c0_g1_i8.p1 TRINITY_DN6734_c0_g1~~TRINITY_DN6734_c0_g1_i8.p1  ORF type:complete len:296 (+),score=43.06 TRINITY_DN6734_c0_g1_i8:68-955(+)
MSIHRPNPQQIEEFINSYQQTCASTAQLIAEADFFLLSVGAGFSADSGLPVYKDVANVPAYLNKNLTYTDLCQPHWLKTDPGLFYGFWGGCFNDYRNTEPHEGYHILKRWQESLFSHRTEFQEEFMALAKEELIPSVEQIKPGHDAGTVFQPEDAKNVPGPFFILTSNVDCHMMKVGFKRTEIYEIHGNTETWACSGPCSERLWLVPKNYRFKIDKEVMVSQSDWPVCKDCGQLARPAVTMFNDRTQVMEKYSLMYFDTWFTAGNHFFFFKTVDGRCYRPSYPLFSAPLLDLSKW